MIQWMSAIWSLIRLPYLNPTWTSGSSWFSKPGLDNLEHYLVNVWDEHNCGVLWAFFGIGMKTGLFQTCGHWWIFQIGWHIECSTFTASSFRIWNISTGIPSPPLALFIVMLPKAHLTSHSRMFGSRCVFAPLCLSESWWSFLYSSVYSCHPLLISSASVSSIPFLSFTVPQEKEMQKKHNGCLRRPYK